MIDLKPACHRMIDLVGRIADDQLALPTPCTEYTVGDLIAHVDSVSRGFAAVARKDPGGQDGPDLTGADLGDDWRDRLARHVRALGVAWDDPAAWEGTTKAADLDMPNQLWGKIALTELVVHGWDLATATGRSFDLPEDTLRACLDHVTEFVPNAPVPELWGAAADVPGDAPLLDRIVAGTGRAP